MSIKFHGSGNEGGSKKDNGNQMSESGEKKKMYLIKPQSHREAKQHYRWKDEGTNLRLWDSHALRGRLKSDTQNQEHPRRVSVRKKNSH